MIRKISVLFGLLCFALGFAQEFQVKQDDDDILFFNQTEQSIEVWVRMQQIAVNEVVQPGEMKKFINPAFLTKEDLRDSEILHAYTYKALTADVNKLFEDFYSQLKQKRKFLNRGAIPIDQPFYRLPVFDEFLENDDQKKQRQNLAAQNLESFVENVVIPQPKNLLNSANTDVEKPREELVKMVSKFIATRVMHDDEETLFLNQMNKVETLFYNYLNENNQAKKLGSLEQNEFKLFTDNPGTNIGIFITTNSFGKIERYDYPEMDTRGFNFEVFASQRFHQSRVSKRRTINYHAAASYLSLKDKSFNLKKSIVGIGPEIRYTGYYENQVELIAEAGALLDITSDKYMVPGDKKQIGYYVGGQLSLLFIRMGVRYYDQVAEPEFSPEGKVFYRLGLVAKF